MSDDVAGEKPPPSLEDIMRKAAETGDMPAVLPSEEEWTNYLRGREHADRD